jgi:D-inositol-3-phosphate glycosyltransferase
MICKIDHLLDDQTPGGVTRLLDHLSQDPGLKTCSRQSVVNVRRGRLTAPRLESDIIVSNLSVSWRNLPFFVTLRAANPHTSIVHVEHSYSESFVAMNVARRDRFEALLRTVYSLVDVIVAVSPEQKRWIARREFCRAEKLRVIEPCGDLKPFLGVRANRKARARCVGAIGRFDTQKGFDLLIDAFRSPLLADHQLRLWGAGAEEKALRARAAGLGNVTFEGFANSPSDAMAECDIVAMPSRWEPYGMIAIEAMAAGRPVLCSRVDGLKNHIQNGAIAVAENTPEQWAARIAGVTEFEIARAIELGRRRAAGANARLVEGWRGLIAGLVQTPRVGCQMAA